MIQNNKHCCHESSILIKIILISIIRKKLYVAILASVLAPALLTVFIFSFPNLNDLGNLKIDETRLMLTVSGAKLGEACYPASLVDGTLVSSNKSLRAIILVVNTDLNTDLGRISGINFIVQCNYSRSVILPRDAYNTLSKPQALTVMLNKSSGSYTVCGIWDSNIVILLENNLNLYQSKYVCLLSQKNVISNIAKDAEECLVSTAALWVLALNLIYLPVFYAAQKHAIESLQTNIRVLYESGASVRTIIGALMVSLTAVHTVAALYACALGVIMVYTAHLLLSFVQLLPPPSLRVDIVPLLLVEAFSGACVSYLACRGALKWSQPR
jgi:hypothetical protein